MVSCRGTIYKVQITSKMLLEDSARKDILNISSSTPNRERLAPLDSKIKANSNSHLGSLLPNVPIEYSALLSYSIRSQG